MNALNWIHFTWDLTKLPSHALELPEHYQIASATRADEKELRKVFAASFMLDPAWNPAVQEVMRKIDSWLERAFDSNMRTCLALRHGIRIIGAAGLSLEPEAENHLTPGPCILMEYRNRGFGTHLLETSLHLLREAGLARAVGVARQNTPVTRFLYPKFHGQIATAELRPLLAA